MKKSTTKHKPTTYAFIDSQNLNLGVKSTGWTLDYGRFRTYLKDKYSVSKAYLFIGHVGGNEGLYTALQEMGYIVVFKPTLVFKEKNTIKTKGNVDAELVLHTMIQWSNFDKAIIVSGDGDFHCLIEHLYNNEKLGKIIVPNKKYSSLLRNYAQFIVLVNMFRRKVEKK
jgi:uncharacterized LabA/DUF88 family protein